MIELKLWNLLAVILERVKLAIWMDPVVLRMFIAANRRRPATTSNVFEFDFDLNFSKY